MTVIVALYGYVQADDAAAETFRRLDHRSSVKMLQKMASLVAYKIATFSTLVVVYSIPVSIAN